MNQRKGIILAGGKGSRLYPMTACVNKQLQSVYDKPMIYYPLSTLMNANIQDILIISSPDQIHNFINLFENGSRLGLNIEYAIQYTPRGLADAFLIGDQVGFIKDDPCALVLGDNVFYGEDFNRDLLKITERDDSTIFGYRVSNPQDYGVVMFDGDGTAIAIEEKPADPISNYAVPGLYFYDDTVVERVKELTPSDRGELEITDLNNTYIETGMQVEQIRDSAAWFDTGNPDQMFEASMFVKSIQARTGLMVGCIESTAYKRGFINEDEFWQLITDMPECEYKEYLKNKYPVLI